MASASIKRTCSICTKCAGTAMCYGCGASFCTKHFIEHRQILCQQLENVTVEYDSLHRESNEDSNATNIALKRINDWERETIHRIQAAAEAAREDLRRKQIQHKARVNESLLSLKQTLQNSQESDDYTEIEIENWMKQLKDLRAALLNIKAVTIDYDSSNEAIIRLIKVIDKNENFVEPQTALVEGFVCQPANPLIICSRNQVTFTGHKLTENSAVTGIGRYSSGVHRIHFYIEHIDPVSTILFGIVTGSEEITARVLNATSTNGWWYFDAPVINGEIGETKGGNSLRNRDIVTLILDCDREFIQLKHHRTERVVQLPIRIRSCPLPWKILVRLNAHRNSVRILEQIQ